MLSLGNRPRISYAWKKTELSTVNCQLSTANCQPPTAKCQLSTVNCQLSTVNCQLCTPHSALCTLYFICLTPNATPHFICHLQFEFLSHQIHHSQCSGGFKYRHGARNDARVMSAADCNFCVFHARERDCVLLLGN